MAKKMNFRNDMREAKTAKEGVEEAERLPTEKGYTRTKRKLKARSRMNRPCATGKSRLKSRSSPGS